jgi:hypothetical protein
MVYGPYMPLESGDYTASFRLRVSDPTDSGNAVRCDILGDQGRVIVAQDYSGQDIQAAAGQVSLAFTLKDLEFGIQARCISRGRIKVECDLPIRFSRTAN